MDLTVHVPRLPGPGETVLATAARQAPGGKGANQAFAARRMGASVRMIGRVGDDAFGAALIARLSNEGVDVSRVGVSDEFPTGLALITVDAHGENTIAVASGANGHLSAADVAGDALASTDVCVGQLEVSTAALEEAFRQARRGGASTLLNAAPALDVPDALWRETDVCVLNAGELAHTTGRNDPLVAARLLLARGPRTVVVTRGAAETLAVTADADVLWVAPPRVSPVDTVGAGDAFVGALASRLRGSLAEAIQYANATGALVATLHGAQPDGLTQAAVERLTGPPGRYA